MDPCTPQVHLPVDDGDVVAVGDGGREGDLRWRKMVRSRDVWFGGCFYRWSSSGEVDDVAAGAGQTTQSFLRHLPVTEVIL